MWLTCQHQSKGRRVNDKCDKAKNFVNFFDPPPLSQNVTLWMQNAFHFRSFFSFLLIQQRVFFPNFFCFQFCVVSTLFLFHVGTIFRFCITYFNSSLLKKVCHILSRFLGKICDDFDPPAPRLSHLSFTRRPQHVLPLVC